MNRELFFCIHIGKSLRTITPERQKPYLTINTPLVAHSTMWCSHAHEPRSNHPMEKNTCNSSRPVAASLYSIIATPGKPSLVIGVPDPSRYLVQDTAHEGHAQERGARYAFGFDVTCSGLLHDNWRPTMLGYSEASKRCGQTSFLYKPSTATTVAM